MANYEQMKGKKANKWVDLPQDVLERISNFCFTPDYILRMQFVCKSWRLILKKSMQRELPWLMLLPNNKEEEEDPDARLFSSRRRPTLFVSRRCMASAAVGLSKTDG